MDARSNPTVTVIFLQAMELKEIGPPGNSVTRKLVLLTVVNPEFPGNWAPTPVFWANTIIIDRNEVVAKVIFLHLSVIHFVYRGVCLSACWDNTPPEQTPPGADTPLEQTTTGADSPPEQTPPPREADSSIRSTSGRYASCWKAFLLNSCLPKVSGKLKEI